MRRDGLGAFGAVSVMLVVATGAAAAGGTLRAPLRVLRDPLLPVCGGIPIPAGRLRPGEPVRARTIGGRLLAVQARPLVTWPDGSVRWLRVDLDPAGKPELVLEGGTAPLSRSAATARATTEGIDVDSGDLSFLVPGEKGLLPRRLRDVRKERQVVDALEVEATSQGVVMTSREATAERLEIEESEGLRVAARTAGRLRRPDGGAGLRVRARIEAYAGRALLRLAIQVVADEEDVSLDSLRLGLGPPHVPLDFVRFAVPGQAGGGAMAIGAAWTLEHGAPSPFTLREGSRVRRTGPRAPGWAVLGSRGKAASISLARFAELSRGRLDVDASRGAWVDLAPPGYVLRARSALRRDLVIGFGSTDTATSGPSASFPDADRLPVLAASPTFAGDSEAAGPLGLASDSALAGFDRLATRVLSDHVAERQRLSLFGPRNFGDWPLGEGFGNLEFDTGLGFLLGFLRTADARWLDEARDALRHLQDVDVEWTDGAPGLPRMHGPDHGEHVECGHIWLEGLLLGGLICADPWATEAGLAIRDALVSSIARSPRTLALERGLGWSLLSVTSAEAWTRLDAPDSLLAETRHALVDAILEAEAGHGYLDPRGATRDAVDEDDPNPFAKRSLRVNPWVTLGITVEALCRAAEIEPDREMIEAIRRIATTFGELGFDPESRAIAGGIFFDLDGLFPPRRTRPVSADAAIFAARGLAHAARVCGDARLDSLARSVARAAMRGALAEAARFGGRERTRFLVAGPALLRHLQAR